MAALGGARRFLRNTGILCLTVILRVQHWLNKGAHIWALFEAKRSSTWTCTVINCSKSTREIHLWTEVTSSRTGATLKRRLDPCGLGGFSSLWISDSRDPGGTHSSLAWQPRFARHVQLVCRSLYRVETLRKSVEMQLWGSTSTKAPTSLFPYSAHYSVI